MNLCYYYFKMRAKEIQYGLRGIDPTNGKALPYETEAMGGGMITVDQHAVDSKIFYQSLKRDVIEMINNSHPKKNRVHYPQQGVLANSD